MATLAAMMVGSSALAVAAATAKPTLNIVSMGDSYTSGTGGYAYYGRKGCYKSLNSYGEQYKDRLKSKLNATHLNVACNGAVLDDLMNQAAEVGASRRLATDLVLLTIGGNDMNFATSVKKCLIGAIDSSNACLKTLSASDKKHQAVADKTYAQLKKLATLFPKANFVLVGYPMPIYIEQDKCKYVHTTSAGSYSAGTIIKNISYQVEANQLNTLDQLNKIFPDRFRFVSTKQLFAGHEICGDKEVWIRDSFTTSITHEWWHPNIAGYSAIANKLYLDAVHANTDELMLMTTGGSEFMYDLKINGSMERITTQTMGAGWDIVRKMEIDGDKGTEVLLYKNDLTSTSGEMRVYDIRPGGHLLLKYKRKLANYWTHMTPIDLDGDGRDELIIYSSTKGNYSFVNVGSNGNISNLSSGRWARGQRSVEAIEIGNGNGQEVIFQWSAYGKGRTATFSTTNKGLHRRLKNNYWNIAWTHVVPIDTDGDGIDEVMLFSRSSGYWNMTDVSTRGVLTSKNSGRWYAGWHSVMVVELNGNIGDELLLVRKGVHSAEAMFFRMNDYTLGSRIKTQHWSNYQKTVLPVSVPQR